MKKSVVSVAVASLMLVGCGSTAGEGEAPEVEPAASAGQNSPAAESAPAAEPSSPESPASAEGDTSDRGNLIKSVGEGATVTNKGTQVASFVINDITVGGKCTSEFASGPENGHFIFLDVSMKTEPELSEAISPNFGLAGMNWTAIAPNGTTSNADPASAAALMCLDDADALPSSLGPAQQATGQIVLDVANPKGTLVYTPMFSNAGWEWEYPVK